MNQEEIFGVKKPAKPKSSKLGCDNCPLNTQPDTEKIFPPVKGRPIMIWGLTPSIEDNRRKKLRMNELLWENLESVKITRDMCDIQTVVRCVPMEERIAGAPSNDRLPIKKELKCCSIFNVQTIKDCKAKLHILLGPTAQKEILGADYNKSSYIIWSEKLNAYAVCVHHPQFFKGSDAQQKLDMRNWRRAVSAGFDMMDDGRYGYLKRQKYYPVTTKKAALRAYNLLKESKERIAVDVESGIVGIKRTMLCCGFSDRGGEACVFALDHETGLEITEEDRAFNWKIVRKILADKDIKKIFHHGSFDVKELKILANIDVQGYDYDTEYGAYFFNPDARAYGLQSIVGRDYIRFTGYKTIVAPEAFTENFRTKVPATSKLSISKLYEMARKSNELDYAAIPWEKLWLYNGADTDITKRIELNTVKKVNMPLMRVYMDAGVLLASMEKRGPVFDVAQYAKLPPIYKARCAKWLAKLREISENENFNPASPAQVRALLFDKLGLEMPRQPGQWSDPAPNTTAETLELMRDQHPAVKYQESYRSDKKIESTYLNSFRVSADKHNGRLATKWWLTGTRTGRLSSGAGKEKDALDQGLVNLQNIINNTALKNMLVSTLEWRDLYKTWIEDGDFTENSWQQYEDTDVMLGFDQAQFEIRVVAERSGDKDLLGVFERDEDIHAEVGSKLMKLPKEDIEKEGPERVSVKGMHFGLIYGLQAAGLLAHLESEYRKLAVKTGKPVVPPWAKSRMRPLDWVQNLLDSYFKTYPKVKQMIEADHAQAEEFGYVETMFGMQQPINVALQQEMGDRWKGAYWRNQAANGPIQGTAHQLLLLGLVHLVRQRDKYKVLQRPTMEVHDAMYFFVKLKNLWKAIEKGTELLELEAIRTARNEFGVDWKVPLKVEPKAGFRFGVQVYKVGQKKGPQSVSEFLNQWCAKNQEVGVEFAAEKKKNLA